MPRKTIIDCDTGLDDAVALLLAIRSPELDIQGITCVAGNVGLDKVLINTRKVVDHSGREIPVYAGSPTAIIAEESQDAANVHGSDGLGGIPFPDTQRQIEDEHAVDFIVRTILETDEPIDLITIGPMTNAALAYLKNPEIAKNIRMLTMMAGGLNSGNTTPAAEYNVFADPEAARILFATSIPKTMVPLDPLWQGGHLSNQNIQTILENNHLPWCDMAGKIFSWTSLKYKEGLLEKGAVSPPDLLAVAVAIDPSIAEIESYQIKIETKGEFTRGMTLLDRRVYNRPTDVPPEEIVQVALTADHKKYSDLVLGAWLE